MAGGGRSLLPSTTVLDIPHTVPPGNSLPTSRPPVSSSAQPRGNERHTNTPPRTTRTTCRTTTTMMSDSQTTIHAYVQPPHQHQQQRSLPTLPSPTAALVSAFPSQSHPEAALRCGDGHAYGHAAKQIQLADLAESPRKCPAARLGAHCQFALEAVQSRIPEVHALGYDAELTKSAATDRRERQNSREHLLTVMPACRVCLSALLSSPPAGWCASCPCRRARAGIGIRTRRTRTAKERRPRPFRSRAPTSSWSRTG